MSSKQTPEAIQILHDKLDSVRDHTLVDLCKIHERIDACRGRSGLSSPPTEEDLEEEDTRREHEEGVLVEVISTHAKKEG